MAMCVLAMAWRAHPDWQFILAGNRDELHARPAQPLARWQTPGHLLAGRDIRSGGTWLGVSEQGRFAVITNLRGFGRPQAGPPSRGLLVRDFLAGDGRYADPSDSDPAAFNPFNLITVAAGAANFLTNRPTALRIPLEPGVHGLSNGALNEAWPKTVRLKNILQDWLAQGARRPESLLDGLREDVLPACGEHSAAPSDVPQEPALSPIFIRNPVYGTRCSTVVALDAAGHGRIVERRFTPDGQASGETALDFSWPG